MHKRQRKVCVANIDRLEDPDGADSLSTAFGDIEILAWVYPDVGLSSSVDSNVQVMKSKKHKDASRRLKLDGARSVPSGQQPAGTQVSLAGRPVWGEGKQ